MKSRPSRLRISLRSILAVIWLLPCSLVATTVAHADDPLGFYIGGAYGQAHIRAQLGPAQSGGAILGEFDGTHSAFQAMLGVRPVSFLGAEITYMDFGQRSFDFASRGGGSVEGAPGEVPTSAQASQKGEAAYALLYLPVPLMDVYLKAGLSRITTDTRATFVAAGVDCVSESPNCNIINVSGSSTDTSFAYGAGLQWKLGQWAVRGEYERFSAAGAHSTLLSIGMTFWLQ